MFLKEESCNLPLQARKEARRQQEIAKREAELLEARKAYFEEVRQVLQLLPGAGSVPPTFSAGQTLTAQASDPLLAPLALACSCTEADG